MILVIFKPQKFPGKKIETLTAIVTGQIDAFKQNIGMKKVYR